MKKILFLAPILAIYGCATKPKIDIEAPDFNHSSLLLKSYEQTNIITKDSSLAEKVMVDFLKAREFSSKGQLKESCLIFTKLSEMKNFPLNDLSLVYSLSDCKYSKRELSNIWNKTEIADYLKGPYFEKSMELAKRFNMNPEIAKFSYELSFITPIKNEKIKLLKDSVFIALKARDEENLIKYKKRMTDVSPKTLLDYKEEIKPSDYYAIGKDFENARDFQRARDFYKKIIDGDFSLDEKVKAYNAYRISFKVSRDLKTFLTKTQEMDDFLEKMLTANPTDEALKEALVEAKINHARAVWTEHQNLEARKILDKLIEQKIGTKNQMATIYWVYALLHLEKQEKTEALKKLEMANEFKITKTDILENIEWTLVWNKYQLKKYKEVVKDTSRFASKTKNTNYENKLNFWHAKALLHLQKESEANELFEDIFEKDQYGYYGLISAMMLEKPLTHLSQSEIITDAYGDLKLDWLIALNESEMAQSYLKSINSTFKSRAQRERAMSLYTRSGWFQGAMAQLFSWPQKQRDEITTQFISAIFPIAYEDIYRSYSQKYDVPIELTMGITRQESSFNTNARSWADAFGLMQLIPEKAQDLSKKYSLTYKDYEDLYKPELNVQMGTLLLGDLRKKFDAKFVQSVAGYNASTAAIVVWEKERFNGDYLEFIEQIPYEETRNYVKIVFRNYITYKRILSDKEFVIPKNFFETKFN